jgi:alpha-1,3-mannosyltransferase
MFIVHVVRQFFPGVGGLEDFVLQLARRQVAGGHQVRVVTLDRIFDDPEHRILPAQERLEGIEIVRLKWRGSKRYPFAPGVLGAIRNADLVHVHALDFFYDFLAATHFIHRRRMVFSTHGLFFHTPFASRVKRLWFATITRLGASAYAGIAASSQQDRARFASVRHQGLVLIENGVALEKFAGVARRDGFNIIAFGRVAPNKRLDRLIDWFARLRAADARWTLTVAGKPMGVAIEDLQAQAAERGVAAAVSFHPAPSDERLRDLIAEASVFACASEYEGFGLAAIEAAAAGLYLALSSIEPFQRGLAATGYGTIVDFAAPGSAQQFLDAFAASRAECPPSAEGLERRFGWSAVSTQFENLYHRVSGRGSRRIRSVAIQTLTNATAIEAIIGKFAGPKPRWVAFANQHTVNVAARDAEVRNMLEASLVLADGVAIDAASKLLFGSAFPENLNGSDFLPQLLTALPPQRIFLLGSAEGVAHGAASRISGFAPQHSIVGTHHGFMDAATSLAVQAQLRASGATLLLVGMGHPYQERWIARHTRDLEMVSITVGAWFDFLSGAVPRAPKWMRQRRLEWAHRLQVEPRRMFSRYVVGGVAFGARIAGQWVRGYRV